MRIALLVLVAEDAMQTQINTLTWALGTERENNYVKLTDYYGTDKEDIYEWYENITRTVNTNKWQATWIHMLVGAYLKEAATDFYKKNRGTFTQ